MSLAFTHTPERSCGQKRGPARAAEGAGAPAEGVDLALQAPDPTTVPARRAARATEAIDRRAVPRRCMDIGARCTITGMVGRKSMAGGGARVGVFFPLLLFPPGGRPG